MRRLVLLFILFLTVLFAQSEIDKRIERIRKAPPEERYKLMNALKRDLVRMRERERVRIIEKLRLGAREEEGTYDRHNDDRQHEYEKGGTEDEAQSHETETERPEHEVTKPEHETESPEHETESPEHEVEKPEHEIEKPEQEIEAPEHETRDDSHDRDETHEDIEKEEEHDD